MAIETLTIMNICLLSGCFLTAILFLFKKSGYRKPTILFSLCILNGIAAVFSSMPYATGIQSPIPIQTAVLRSFLFLQAPLVYFCVKSFRVVPDSFRKRDALHCIPFITFLFLELSRRYPVLENVFHRYNAGDLQADIRIFYHYIFPAALIHSLIYLTAAFIQIRKKERPGQKQKSMVPGKKSAWIEASIIEMFIMFAAGTLMVYCVDVSIHIQLQALMLSFFVYLNASRIWHQNTERIWPMHDAGLSSTDDISLLKPVENGEGGYRKAWLPENLAKRYGTMLMTLLETRKLYKNPNLALHTLCHKLDISRSILSYVINEHLGCTFNDLVNRYRVEEVKKQFQEPDSETRNILDIALDSGFNSKATFNRAFKQFANNTPSQYRNQVLKKTHY